MEKRFLVGLIGFLGVLVALSGCPTIPDGLMKGKGTLVLRITDPGASEIEGMEKLEVTILGIEVHKEGTGWTVFLEEEKTFDLMQLKEAIELLGEKELETGKYTQIRLTIKEAKVTVNSETFDVKVPSEKIKLVKEFRIKENKTTELILDFKPESVKKTAEGYVMTPVIKVLTTKEFKEEKCERIEGQMVCCVRGTDECIAAQPSCEEGTEPVFEGCEYEDGKCIPEVECKGEKEIECKTDAECNEEEVCVEGKCKELREKEEGSVAIEMPKHSFKEGETVTAKAIAKKDVFVSGWENARWELYKKVNGEWVRKEFSAVCVPLCNSKESFCSEGGPVCTPPAPSCKAFSNGNKGEWEWNQTVFETSSMTCEAGTKLEGQKVDCVNSISSGPGKYRLKFVYTLDCPNKEMFGKGTETYSAEAEFSIKGEEEGEGTLLVGITDKPSTDFTALNVTITEIDVHKAGEEENEDENESKGEWIDFWEGEKTFDLMQLQGVYNMITEDELSAGHYTQIRLKVSKATVTVEDGNNDVNNSTNEFDVKVPSDKIKLVHEFWIKKGETTELILDFKPESVKKAGDKYVMSPVIKIISPKDLNKGEECSGNEIVCEGECVTAECYSDTDCDDQNALTADLCINPGTCEAECVNEVCEIECYADSECDDQNALTTDTCVEAGSCNATCSNELCEIECSADTDCDDQNSLTTDTCQLAGTCESYCSNDLNVSNSPPEADANGPYTGNTSTTFLIIGTGSDSDGTVEALEWMLDGNCSIQDQNWTGLGTSFAVTEGQLWCPQEGIFSITLTATDNEGAIGTDTAHITIDGNST